MYNEDYDLSVQEAEEAICENPTNTDAYTI